MNPKDQGLILLDASYLNEKTLKHLQKFWKFRNPKKDKQSTEKLHCSDKSWVTSSR